MATVTYKKLTYDGSKIQVDSAIRDGAGNDIVGNYQVKLVNQTNIKSINGNSLLGSGDLSLSDIGVSAVFVYKGTKATYSELPSSGNVVGDVWNVTAAYQTYPAGTNFVWSGSAWDALGGTVDLSPYLTITDAQSTYQPILTAGANINISGTTISATDTTYSAGNGLTLSSGVFASVITASDVSITES